MNCGCDSCFANKEQSYLMWVASSEWKFKPLIHFDFENVMLDDDRRYNFVIEN